VLVAFLRVLRDDPYASDVRLAERLRTTFPHVDAARIAEFREELGIQSAVRRPQPRAMLAEAIVRLAPAVWLRRKLDDTLRLGEVRNAPPPWPIWWRLQHEQRGAAPGQTLLELGGELLAVRSVDLERARELWERHRELVEHAGEVGLRASFADLVANAAAPADASVVAVMRAVAETGRWLEPLPSSRGPLAVEDVTAMLRVCPPADWDVVLQVATERKLTVNPEADATDVLIELLAHAAALAA
jgi:hypothetical protein